MIDIEGFRSYLYEEELAPNTIAAYVRGVTRFSEMFDEITKPNLIAFKQHRYCRKRESIIKGYWMWFVRI